MSLRQKLRVLRRFLIVDLKMAMTYRFEFAMYMVSAMLMPIIGLMTWRAAIASGAALPMTASEVTTYFVLLGLVVMLTSSWISGFLAQEIRLGGLNKWLIRPGSTHFNGIANNVSEKIIKSVPLVPMVAITWFFVRDDIDLPSGATVWLLFVLAMLFAAVMSYALDIVFGGLAFWMDDIFGFRNARDMVGWVLGGQLVPLALMPSALHGFLEIQPFRFMLSFPLEVVMGSVTGRDLWLGFALQATYTVLVVWGAITLWRRGLRDYAGSGT